MRLLILEELWTGKHFKEKIDKERGFKTGDIYWTFIKGSYIPNKVIKIIDKKEVKKMNKLPYFETKVVRTKKVENKYFRTQIIDGRIYGYYYSKDKQLCLEEIKKKQPKGHWVNGENLDKIKFPCFCSYRSHSGKKHYAQLNEYRGGDMGAYKLSRLFQDEGENIFLSADTLKKLIRKWDIHILKGKIIIFEEEN